MGYKRFGIGVILPLVSYTFLGGFLAAENKPENPALADAFKTSESSDNSAEVEPVVVGREKWNAPAANSKNQNANNTKLSNSPKIEELDALETKQSNLDPSGLPLLPPKVMPAVNVNRNFEGILVLKPRKLGFQNDFPYQLENSTGRRLAVVDTKGLNAVNPISYNGKKVNLLGKLEPTKQGSKDFVIRAKVIRLVD